MSAAARLSLFVLIGWAALAALAPLLRLTPDAISLPEIMQPPSWASWLGHDDLGRPMADRLICALRTSLLVVGIVVPLSAASGAAVGVAAAWRGGLFDACIARLMDVFLAFPGTLLAIAMAGLLGPGIGNVVIALTAVSWVGYARMARAQAYAVKTREHVHAARVLGTPAPAILLRHVLPLIAAPLLMEATLGVAGVILAEAGLSFLGLGVQPPSASLGAMLRDGTAYMLVAPHMVIVPGLALLALMLACNTLGDALQHRLDPRRTLSLMPAA
ncbi:MAG: Glutathione transport system permease protein GsiD [Gammaproteobacteria bacterium]|nr:Glutathione transport system permease protein GsiD [Gammaproteobacteria bacterium]